MGKIRNLYDTRVRPMPPAERLQLARLIIDDLAPPEKPLDVSDDWSHDDLTELTAFSAHHAASPSEDLRGIS